MKQRIITAAIALAIFIPCLIFSEYIVFDIVIALITVLAVFEMIRCVRQAKNLFLVLPSLLLAAIVPFTVRRIKTGVGFPTLLLIVVVIYILYVFSVAMFSKGKLAVTDAALAAMMVIYIITGSPIPERTLSA